MENMNKFILFLLISLNFHSIFFSATNTNTQAQTARLCLAIDIPDDYQVANVQKYLKNQASKLLNKDIITLASHPHTTLVFLGDTSINKITKLTRLIEADIDSFKKANSINNLNLAAGARLFPQNYIVLKYDKQSSVHIENLLKKIIPNLVTNKFLTQTQANSIYARFAPHISLGILQNPNQADIDSLAKSLFAKINPPKLQIGQKGFTPKNITLYDTTDGGLKPIKTWNI